MGVINIKLKLILLNGRCSKIELNNPFIDCSNLRIMNMATRCAVQHDNAATHTLSI